MAEPKPEIILVHGVWSDGSTWREVITLLAHRGYTVTAAQIPLTSFEDDVDAVNRAIDYRQRPVVLVGHSYAGGVISSAGNHPNVKQLVYIAALATQPGETLGAVLGRNPPAANVDLRPDRYGFHWATEEQFRDAFAHDVHPDVCRVAIAVQKPFAGKIFSASIAEPAWQSKPSWYLIATEDRILSPKTQREIASEIKAMVRETAAGHLPLLSQPFAVAEIISEATRN